MNTTTKLSDSAERPGTASFEEGFQVEPSALRPTSRPPGRRSGLIPWLVGGVALALLGTAALAAYLLFGEDKPVKPPEAKPQEPEAKRKELAKNLFLEVQGDKRRVILKGEVCLREGEYQLEGLVCKKMTKEHEYILHVDVDARLIHAALIAAGAKPGSPVKFEPKYAPPCGTPIKITLQYQKGGKLVRVPAQEWILDAKTKKHLQQDWVFGGSVFIPDPDDPKQPPIYLANHGDLVCLVNMESAMLDLPFRSPGALDDRIFKPNTERIPPLETPVDIILEPVVPKKEPERGK